MRTGRVSSTITKRSIIKQLNQTQKEPVLAPSAEEMCTGIQVHGNEQVIFSDISAVGNEPDIGVFAMAAAANHVAARGAVPQYVHTHILLSPDTPESHLKELIKQLVQQGESEGITVLNAKAQVSPAVLCPIVQVTAVGTVAQGALRAAHMGLPGQDVVMAGWTGLAGTLRILNAREQELKERFVPAFLNPLKEMKPQLFALSAASIARQKGIKAMHQVTEGGVLAGLWELAEGAGIGMEIELKKMPIRQETVEVCEFVKVNPYQLCSTGAILMLADQGEELTEALWEQGIAAAVVGRSTDKQERVIIDGSEKRFLDRPQEDELTKINITA